MEGIGAEPQLQIVLEGGVQEEHFGQQGLDIAQMINVAGLGPPVLVLHEAAAARGAFAFMGHGIQFPAHMQGAGLHIGFDFHTGHYDEADDREVAQQVKQCCHAISPMESRCRCITRKALARFCRTAATSALVRLAKCPLPFSVRRASLETET